MAFKRQKSAAGAPEKLRVKFRHPVRVTHAEVLIEGADTWSRAIIYAENALETKEAVVIAHGPLLPAADPKIHGSCNVLLDSNGDVVAWLYDTTSGSQIVLKVAYEDV